MKVAWGLSKESCFDVTTDLSGFNSLDIYNIISNTMWLEIRMLLYTRQFSNGFVFKNHLTNITSNIGTRVGQY